MTLLALPKPLAAAGVLVSAAAADCSRNMVPRLMPKSPEPPTRRMSLRLQPRLLSHKSLPGRPGTMIIIISSYQLSKAGVPAEARSQKPEARSQEPESVKQLCYFHKCYEE